MSNQDMPVNYRFEFAKTGKSRFLSHLDLMRTLQRALNRAQLPVYHTEGFNPHVYVAIALPLPLGCEGLRELADIRLYREPEDNEQPLSQLNGVLPEGIFVTRFYQPALPQKKIAYAGYETIIRAGAMQNDLYEQMKKRLNQPQLFIKKRNGEETDIKPLIRSVEIVAGEDHIRINSVLRCSASAVLNPFYFGQALLGDGTDSACVLHRRNGFLTEDLAPFQ